MRGTYEYNNRQLLKWYFDVVLPYASTEELHNSVQQIFDDLVFCSDELIYFTAHLFLYRPYIDNPLENGQEFNGEIVYSNIQNLEGKRYSMFTDVAFQKTYNYWDRIGDLLAKCFPHKLKENFINFSSVMDVVSKISPNSLHFLWLKNFKENEYLNLNQTRKQIVHFISPSISFKYQHLEESSNQLFLQNLQSQRLAMADYFKKQVQFMLSGFEAAISLLEEYWPLKAV